MKQIIYILIWLLMPFLWSLQTNAQTQTGLRLGLNATTVRGVDVQEKLKTGVGYNAGIFVRLNLADIKLQTELVVSGRNYAFAQNLKDLQTLEIAKTEKEIKATYLDIPLLIFIKIEDNLHFVVGPQASIHVGHRQKVTSGDPRGDDFTFSSELGGTAGLTYELKNGFDFTLRGVLGLSEIFEKTNEGLAGDKSPDIRTLMVQLTLGLPLSTQNKTDEPDRSSYKTIY